MSEPSDHQLLGEFADNQSEDAFAALIGRYINLVYSTAFRCARNAHHAEEIAQAVFIILARKAGTLSPRVVLSGWLYQATRLTAANFMKGEIRRQRREQEVYMQSTLNEPELAEWNEMAPLLDEAMGNLGQTDRDALVLRFFQNKNSAEIGLALRMTEETARKRVNRALDKLRYYFSKRGVNSTTAIIANTVSAHSVQAAPAGLAKTISAIAVTKGAATSTSTLTLIKGALKIMAWTQAKTAITAGVIILLAAGTTTVAVKHVANQSNYDAWRIKPYFDSRNIDKAPPQLRIVATSLREFGGYGEADGKIMGLGAPVKYIVQAAYSFGDDRTVSLMDYPTGRYDFIASLPSGDAAALQQEIKKQFGLVAHTEMIETNVLLLEVQTPNAPGLVVSHSRYGGMSSGSGRFQCNGYGIESLAGCVEGQFGIPVIDQTGLKKTYDIKLRWRSKNDLKQKLIDQLGLALVPSTMPVQMLVVEKAD